MSSNDATSSSPSATLHSSEDDTLEREIDYMIKTYGRDSVMEMSDKVRNIFNPNVEEQKVQKYTCDFRERFAEGDDVVKEKILSLVDKFGPYVHLKIAREVYSHTRLLREFYESVKRDRQTFNCQMESPTKESADSEVLASVDEDEAERMRKKINLGEGSKNPDQSHEQRLDCDSSYHHGIKDQDQEIQTKKEIGGGEKQEPR